MKLKLQKFLFLLLMTVAITSNGQYLLPEYIQHVDQSKPLIFTDQFNGGYQEVADLTERNAIPSAKRAVGMMVTYYDGLKFVTERYEGSDVLDVNWLNADNWGEISGGNIFEFIKADTLVLGGDTILRATTWQDAIDRQIEEGEIEVGLLGSEIAVSELGYQLYSNNLDLIGVNRMGISSQDMKLVLDNTNGAATFTDFGDAGTRSGIEYADDYSDNYSSRSIVDSAFVGNAISNIDAGLWETNGTTISPKITTPPETVTIPTKPIVTDPEYILSEGVGGEVSKTVAASIDSIATSITEYTGNIGNNLIPMDTLFSKMNRQTSTYHLTGGFEDESEVIDVVQNVYSQITNATGNLWTGIDAVGFSIVNDKIIVNNTAHYDGSCNISFYGNTGVEFKFRLYNETKNEQISFAFPATGDGATDPVPVTIPFYMGNVDSGDVIYMEVTNPQSSVDPTIRTAFFKAKYFHD